MKPNANIMLTPAQIATLQEHLCELHDLVGEAGADKEYEQTGKWLPIVNQLSAAMNLLDKDDLKNESNYKKNTLPILSRVPKEYLETILAVATQAVDYVNSSPNRDKIIFLETEANDPDFNDLSFSYKNSADLSANSITETIEQARKQPNALKTFHMHIDFSLNALKNLFPKEENTLKEIKSKHQKVFNPLTRLRCEKARKPPSKEYLASALGDLRQFIKSNDPLTEDKNADPTATHKMLGTITESLDKAEGAFKELTAQRSR